MRLMGWHDRSMVDRYAADMQDQRAYEAKQRRGDLYSRFYGGAARSFTGPGCAGLAVDASNSRIYF